MPSFRAASFAFSSEREAMAAMRDRSPFCMAGITFSTAILATPRMPQATLSVLVFMGLKIPEERRGGNGLAAGEGDHGPPADRADSIASMKPAAGKRTAIAAAAFGTAT